MSIAIGSSGQRVQAAKCRTLLNRRARRQLLPLQASAQPQEPAVAAQPQGGSCFDKYSWIQPALDVWFEKAWAAANESTQSTEQALQVLRDTMWNK